MRRISFLGYLLLCIMPHLGWAQTSKQPPRPASTSSLCAANEHTVFSCVLRRNKKHVSLCATKDLSHFYYIYGRPGTPELIFPPENKSSRNLFTNTHLFYGGPTAGIAYSFVNESYKYIIYSITNSGADGFYHTGMIVQETSDVNNMRAIQQKACQRTSVIETDNNIIRNITDKWPNDTAIEKYGLLQVP